MKLAGVTVLYHPDKSVIENIHSYIDDLDVLFVVDNTEDPKEDIVSQIKRIPKTQYVPLGDNMGIPYALNYALKRCENYPYLLTMDQDSAFPEGGLKEYKRRIAKIDDEDIAAYTVQFTSIKGVVPTISDSKIVKRTITSGMIVNTQIAKEIGGFADFLFIDAVDYEFCYRVYAYGYKVWLFCGIVLNHQIGMPELHKLLWKNPIISNHPAIRRYYIARNNLYLLKQYKENMRPFIDDCIKGIIKAMLFEKNKKGKLKATLWGLWDGLCGNMGKCKRHI